MISLKELYENFMRHTHTLASLGAASASHTHTLQSLGAADANHTHSPQSLGLGLQLIADGGGGPLIRADVSGKTLAVLYISTSGSQRWYPVTFAIQGWALGANVLDRDRNTSAANSQDNDAVVNLALNGTTLTISRANKTSGLGRLYVM